MRGREVDVSFHLSYSIRHFIIGFGEWGEKFEPTRSLPLFLYYEPAIRRIDSVIPCITTSNNNVFQNMVRFISQHFDFELVVWENKLVDM